MIHEDYPRNRKKRARQSTAGRRGLPERQFAPQLPMLAEQAVWLEVAQAAIDFWHRAAGDMRFSTPFRQTCAENAGKAQLLIRSPVLTAPDERVAATVLQPKPQPEKKSLP